MDSVLLWLERLNPIFQAATLVALIVYVWKTWAMASATEKAANASQAALREMKAAREAETRPYILCYFAPSAGGRDLDLVVANTGQSMAFDVAVQFNPPVQRLAGRGGAVSLSSKHFSAMAPGLRWRWRAGSTLAPDPNAAVEAFEALVAFSWGPSRHPEEYKVSFDAASLRGGCFEDSTLPAQFLESMADSLSEMVDLEVAKRKVKDDA